MISVTAVREALAAAVPGVIPRAVDGLAEFPAVVLGMPKWEPGPGFCYSQLEFPVAVIVSRPGISDDDTVHELDDTWPAFLDQLQAAIDQDQTLGGACAEVQIVRAEFGLFTLQGQQWPAQIIFVQVTG